MKKLTTGKARKKCVELAKLIAKERDKYRCHRCPKAKSAGWKMEASHIKNEGRHTAMSADPDNIICLCSDCHRWWHAQPDESGIWFREKFTELAKELDERAKTPKLMTLKDWQKKLEQLKTNPVPGNR